MQWLRRILLVLGMTSALGVFLLDWQLLWHVERFAQDTRRVNELSAVTVLMFGIAGLYAVLFLLTPWFTAQVMKKQTDRMLESVQSQLRVTLAELREVKDQTEKLLREQARGTRNAA
jgi:Tfp pilus assembly protein PilN